MVDEAKRAEYRRVFIFPYPVKRNGFREEAEKENGLLVRDSFRFLSDHKYLACIAILVVSYNLVINLVEVIWKDQLRELILPRKISTLI